MTLFNHQHLLDRLIQEIETEVTYTRGYTGRDRLNPRVYQALRRVARHRFVPRELEREAYANRPLPIGHGQTISQPYIVALMTDLLDLDEQSVVLEVGTGSAYQAAVLAELAGSVYSIELVPELAQTARQSLRDAGYSNVAVREGNGAAGWPEYAPYDGIIVTAAAPTIPPALVEQLKVGGRLVIPIGMPWGSQQLMRGIKQEAGGLALRDVLPVAFVPLVGEVDPESLEAPSEPG